VPPVVLSLLAMYPGRLSLRPGGEPAYLSEVPARGGGTLVVEGSHRLAAAYPGAPSRTVRGQLSQQDPWLREIWHPAGREDRIAALMDHGAEVAGVRPAPPHRAGARCQPLKPVRLAAELSGRRFPRQDERHTELASVIRFGVLN
jgi:hypothetical protein